MIGALLPMAASASSWPSFQGNSYNNGVTDEDITTTFATNWTSTTAAGQYAGLESGTVIDDNNVVYCVNYNGTVYAFNLTTGNQIWNNTGIANSDPYSFECCVPAYGDDRLYVGLSNGSYEGTNIGTAIYALNSTDGTVVWYNSNDSYFPPSHQLNSPIKYESGELYFGSIEFDANNTEIGGYFYCVNASDGEVAWRYNNGTCGFNATSDRVGIYQITADGEGDIIVTNTKTGQVKEYDRKLGKVTDIVFNDNTGLLEVTTETYLYMLDFNPGTGVVGNVIISKRIRSHSTLAVTDNYVYVGTDDGLGNGSVLCFNSSNLDLIDTINISGPIRAPPVVTTYPENEERVYVTTYANPGRCYWLTFNTTIEEFTSSGYWEPAGSNYTLQGISFANGWLVYGNDAGYLYGATGF